VEDDRAFAFDYYGTGKLDHLVFYRPGTGICYILEKSGDQFRPVYETSHGIGTYDLASRDDRAFAFDYYGTGKLDHLVFYRPGTGICYILEKSGDQFRPVYETSHGIGTYDLASRDDRAFAFDYYGTGKLDHLVFYRPGTGICYILEKSSDQFRPVYETSHGIGTYDLASRNDRAFAFDYGTGKLDHLVFYRPGTGICYILERSGNQFGAVYPKGDPAGIGGYDLASRDDRALAFDNDSTGKPDHPVLYRPGTGIIWIYEKLEF
jgi:hypothetical protein